MKADWSRERALLSNRRACALAQTLTKNGPDGHGAFCVKIIKGSLVEEGERRRKKEKKAEEWKTSILCINQQGKTTLARGAAEATWTRPTQEK